LDPLALLSLLASAAELLLSEFELTDFGTEFVLETDFVLAEFLLTFFKEGFN